MSDDAPAAFVRAHARGEPDLPIEPPQPDSNIQRAPSDVFDGLVVAATDDVDEGFSDDQCLAVHSDAPFIPAPQVELRGCLSRPRCAGS